MAQTTNDLRDILEKIKGDAQRALALLPGEAELRSLSWKCTACGQVKHFTRPVTAAVADRCPKCKGDSFRVSKQTTPILRRETWLIEDRQGFDPQFL